MGLPLHVYDFGVTGDGSDESTNFQIAIDAAQAQGRTLFAPGRYFVKDLTWAAGKPFALRGEAGGVSPISPFAVPRSRLRRAEAGRPILTGPSSGAGEMELFDIELYAPGDAGELLNTPTLNRWRMRNVHFRGAVDTAWHVYEIFNGSATDLFFTDCGNGATNPAWLFDSRSGQPQPGSSINKFSNVTMIGSQSSIKTQRTGSGLTAYLQILGLSMERYGGTFPHLHLAGVTEGCYIQGDIFMGDGTGVTAPVVHDSSGSSRANELHLNIDRTQGSVGPSYGVQHKSGYLILTSLRATGAGPVAVRIESTVSAGAFQHGPIISNATTLIDDQRTTRHAWHELGTGPPEPDLVNSWANLGAQTAAFLMVDHRYVQLKGRVGGGATGSTIFTLPAAYRPTTTRRVPVNANNAYGMVTVNTDGTVVLTVGSGADVDLSPVRFIT